MNKIIDSKKVVFWGASGHAKVLKECIDHERYRLVAVFDNNCHRTSPFRSVPIYIGPEGFQEWLNSGVADNNTSFLIAIGGDKGKDRVALHDMLTKSKLPALSIIHPKAFVAQSAEISEGCQVLAGASVCVDVRIGMQTIVNTNASIDHECEIGRGVHVAPGATIAGCVEVGEFTMIAAGAAVLPRIKIGKNSIIGAGAVVTKDVPDDVVVYGNPAKVIRPKDH